MTDEVVLLADRLCKTFEDGKEKVFVLRGISFAVARGQRVAIMGTSGSGKTTLLHLLGGLDQASDGSVWVGGQDIHALSEKQRSDVRNRFLGFVYQFHHLLPEFTALENVLMPLFIRGVAKKEAIEKSLDLLAKVGLSHRLHHKMHALSGGERQRVAIARALVGDPACVLADEPTGNLDEKNATMIVDLLVDLNEHLGMSLVVVTHDPRVADRMHVQYQMRDGLMFSPQAAVPA